MTDRLGVPDDLADTYIRGTFVCIYCDTFQSQDSVSTDCGLSQAGTLVLGQDKDAQSIGETGAD